MTPETYYEMCDQLGTEPDITLVPIDYDDLSIQSQVALNVFEYCTDKWDTMNGRYIGKDLSNLDFIYNVLEVEPADWSIVLLLLNTIINVRIDTVNKKMKNKMKLAK